MKSITLTFFTKEDCPLCEKAKQVLIELSNEFPLNLEVFDIYQNDQLLEEYQLMIPVIELAGVQLGYGMIDKQELRKQLLIEVDNR